MKTNHASDKIKFFVPFIFPKKYNFEVFLVAWQDKWDIYY